MIFMVPALSTSLHHMVPHGMLPPVSPNSLVDLPESAPASQRKTPRRSSRRPWHSWDTRSHAAAMKHWDL